VLRIGSGRFDGRIGDGDGPRACRGPDAGIEADGKVRPGVPGWYRPWYPLVTHSTASGTQRQFAGPKDFGPLGRCTHIGVGARRDRFSTIDERGRRCLREPAHGLGKCLRAMARRRRRLPDLRISAPSGFARILVRARDATDFRPSMNGVGGAFASRRTVWGSV
jgi:hypothetical protein